MKNILYILLLFPCLLLSQTPGKNYVKTTTYKEAYTAIPGDPECDVQVSYFDGIGRPVQTVLSNSGGDNQDIIIHVDYDMYGRPVKEYLPFAAPGNGTIKAAYQTNAIDSILGFYNKTKYENTSNPYSEKRYENSPLNRVKEQAAPGAAWKLNDVAQNDFYFQSQLYIFDENVCTSNDLLPLPRPTLIIEVKNNTLIFTLYTPPGGEKLWGDSLGCAMTPQQKLLISADVLPVLMPDLNLGELKNELGLPTGYRAFIQNGYVKLVPVVAGVFPLVKRFDTKMSVDLNPYMDVSTHTVKYDYLTNTTNEVRRFGVKFIQGSNDTELTTSGFYAPRQLFKTVTKDENWTKADLKNKTTEEFTDKLGKTVLKRTYNNNVKHDTYYVYDIYSNLAYVIPPKATDAIFKSNVISSAIGVNFPWTKLVSISDRDAQKFETDIAAVPNADILNVDLFSTYGGRGGFSVIPDEDNNIILNINITTAKTEEYRTGVMADLSDLGVYADKELGRIVGNGYNYIFSIIGNKIEVNGYGRVPSINTTLTGYKKLQYSKNYPWTKLCIANAQIAELYEKNIKDLENSEILTNYTANANGASGGIAINLDEFDNLSVSVNVNSTVPMELTTGMVFPLDIERSVIDRKLGTAEGIGYKYEFSIRDNSLFIEGIGIITNLVFNANQLIKEQLEIITAAVNSLCFIYHYDKRNLVIEKHIPDNGWTHMIYDKRDRLVLSQDENQRAKKSWLYTKYDVLDRVIITGSYVSGLARHELETTLNSCGLYEQRLEHPAFSFPGGITFFYTNNNAFPSVFSGEIYTIQYYDTYLGRDFPIDLEFPDMIYDAYSASAKGLPTVSNIRILGGSEWISSAVAYDQKGRTIGTKSVNWVFNAETTVLTDLDFTGRVIETNTKQSKNGQSIDINDYYSYDDGNRLLAHYQSINNGPSQAIAFNHYDALGQLYQKKVGGTQQFPSPYQYNQTIDYTYNIRGWLKAINNPENLGTDLFGFKITYNKPHGYSLYNGNITQTQWKTSNDNILRRYDYEYDALNRLKESRFYKNNVAEQYHEGGIVYDKNGNIQNLKRWGLKNDATTLGLIDDLSYNYKVYSNQLLKVTDNSLEPSGFTDSDNSRGDNDYGYDASGNMKKDLNKGIGLTLGEEITYNHLNLPVKIIKDDNNYLEFTYDATGTKLQKKEFNQGNETITQYLNGFVYLNNELEYFAHPEGYVDKDFSYIYQYKDHLGNVRLTYKKNGSSLQILEEDNYYPFGLKHKGYNKNTFSSSLGQKIKYQGQEFQNELQLGWYSFKWRNYNTEIARFMSIDPLTEDYEDYTPYQFASNQPVHAQEVEGLENSHDLNKRLTESSPTQNDAISRTKPQMIALKSSQSSRGSDNINISEFKTNNIPIYQGGYVGESFDNLITKGIQWLGGKVSGSDVSEEASQNIQLGTSLLIVVLTKGKNTKADAEVVEQLTKTEGKAGLSKISKPGKGKGSVEKIYRDPKRVATKNEKAKMLDKRGGKCEGCDKEINVDKARAHHTKRHADGGKTSEDNLNILCEPCHKEIHQ